MTTLYWHGRRARRGEGLDGTGLAFTMTVDAESDRFRDLETRRLAAVVAGNAEVLNELHASNFVLCTPSGDVWSRRHYLDGLVDGSIDYLRFEPVTPIEVMSDFRLAVLRYRSERSRSVSAAALSVTSRAGISTSTSARATLGAAGGPKRPTPITDGATSDSYGRG